jgi:hypothetical protein
VDVLPGLITRIRFTDNVATSTNKFKRKWKPHKR